MKSENHEITVKTTHDGLLSMIPTTEIRTLQNVYVESKTGGRPVHVFSATSGLDGFMSVLRSTGIALLFHPAIEFDAEVGLYVGKCLVIREIFQFVRVFGSVIQLLSGSARISLDQVVGVTIGPGFSHPRGPVRIV